MIETFKTLRELKEKYLTISDFKKVLQENYLPSSTVTIRRWENLKIIPSPKRIMLNGYLYRGYLKKEGFGKLIEILNKKAVKTIK